jgi:hypothetical protein
MSEAASDIPECWPTSGRYRLSSVDRLAERGEASLVGRPLRTCTFTPMT